jgi:hypothetical protein
MLSGHSKQSFFIFREFKLLARDESWSKYRLPSSAINNDNSVNTDTDSKNKSGQKTGKTGPALMKVHSPFNSQALEVCVDICLALKSA